MVTNAVNIAFALTTSRIRVVVVGGMLEPANYETTGPLAVETLRTLHLDVAVLGANGLDPRFGASTHTEEEAAVGHIFGDRADVVVMATDASKLERRALFRMVDWADVDYLVSDHRSAATCARWKVHPVAVDDASGLWQVAGHVP